MGSQRRFWGPLEQNRVDVQEVTGKNAGRLGFQELPPCRRRPARRWPETGRRVDIIPGATADAVQEWPSGQMLIFAT